MLMLFILALLVMIVCVVFALAAFKADNIGMALICAVVAIVCFLGMVGSCVIIIEPGQVGVPVTLGTVDDNVRQAGISIVSPITDIVLFSIKTQEDSQQASVLTAEGLNVNVDMTTLYHLDPAKVSEIYKTVGENYKGVILDPQIRSVIRDVMATYNAKDIYSSDRSNISARIFDSLTVETHSRGIVIESIQLRSTDLPQKIKDSIEAKQQMEQQIQQKQFEVQKEQMEAQRKVAEANGIADANKIISNSLSNHYLQWYWIQQLNGKDVFYVPVGSDGYPVNLVKDVDTPRVETQ